MNFQDKFLSVLKRKTEARNCDFVINYRWANWGKSIITPKNSFKALITMTFNFQDDCFGINNDFINKSDLKIYAKNTSETEIDNFLTLFESKLNER